MVDNSLNLYPKKGGRRFFRDVLAWLPKYAAVLHKKHLPCMYLIFILLFLYSYFFRISNADSFEVRYFLHFILYFSWIYNSRYTSTARSLLLRRHHITQSTTYYECGLVGCNDVYSGKCHCFWSTNYFHIHCCTLKVNVSGASEMFIYTLDTS
jgi:hypothetical protein